MIALPLMAAAASAATAAPVADLNLADTKCIAVIAAIASREDDPLRKSGLASGMMYYIGRVDGRTPGYDYAGEITRLFGDKSFVENEFEGEANRCGNEMTAKGKEVRAFGQALKAAGRKAVEKPGD
ncbi:hypothetical protein RXV95_01680 [Novosphingobium sp. ZN18A2]|uniref:hypothetical protein n=1 Tax=Novosphingobium sp. ZN18A2 TaxID=3079861 RepID=UPI0030CB961A